ncbi:MULTISPECIES: PadR family transcriptional regulator [Pontibacillus]|uniref:PadR family transcriptional regulator n=1 Tax=Pontibacillus chungwhensis TaxID=265426 RepID=A0ABY8UWB7_9BACI|nr:MULTISPECIES: PadR family transcriptional regulator [Pontibacillus]MCD5323429.1 PadR family transcriptional regulator [Pontibacillus sp. HN14]WIF96809.1 PadR family transcriptional regulator [Pontibacillus chungwhensis]
MARSDTLEAGELTDTSFYILLSLTEARHGYLIMQRIEELTNGKVSIGPASLYTTIKKLLSGGFIEQQGEGTGKRKTYIATERGIHLLKKDMERRENILAHARLVLNEEGEQ